MPRINHPKICPVCFVGTNFTFIRDYDLKKNSFSLYQCRSCNVQFWLPLKAPNYKWYKEANPYKVRELAGSRISRGYHKDFLRRYKSFPKNTKVLDLGCGTGEFIAELEKRGCNVWGLDFDREANKIAKERFGLENVYFLSFAEFFQRRDLPKFDIVTFFEVIEHLDNPLEFIKNVKKILKPRGKIVLSTPYRERILANLNNWDFPPHHFTRWNEEAIMNIFKKCGFYITQIQYTEQLKIISESIIGKFKTGLVNKSLIAVGGKKNSLVFPKFIYFLGRLKDLILGKFPAIFLWVFSKIVNRKNGIMLIELEEKCSELPVHKKVIFFLPTLGVGGGERVVSELSLNFPGFIKTVIVLFKNQISYPYKGKLICLNIPISNPLFFKIYYFFVAIFRLKKVIKREKPDFIISFGTSANVINVLSNKKTIVRIDNFMSSSAKGLYGILIKLLFNKAPQIVCVSKTAAKDLVENFGIKEKKIRVIYNPLNIKEIENLALEPLKLEHQEIFEKPVIINMGRMMRQKSQWYLIRAFRGVKNTIKQAQLVILGTGELEPELNQLVKDFGLENDVHFLGWQKNPFKFLARSKVFVLSSLWEGLPYVVLEAMACGIPIISADCKSGPREILAPKTDINHEAKNIEYEEFGILTPAFDGKKRKAIDRLTKSEGFLKKAIVEILTNKKRASSLAKKSRQRAGDFDIKKNIKEWEFLGQDE